MLQLCHTGTVRVVTMLMAPDISLLSERVAADSFVSALLPYDLKLHIRTVHARCMEHML